jgi:hypothetical protein
MLGLSWIQLIRRIPVDYHDKLAIVTVTGLELVVQSIVRLENEYMVLRGRMAGTNDAGRVLIVPYDQMTFLGFNKRMMDPEIQGIFGPSEFPTHAAAAAAAPAESAPESAPAETPTDQGPAKPAPVQAAPVSKSVLLARLRQRLATEKR